MERPANLLNKAFQLAYFIHCQRSLSLTIARQAMANLEIAIAAQDKRRYYAPVGRRSRRKRQRDKVSMGRAQLLQRLVYCESEPFERQQEAPGNGARLTAEDMTVRFIEYLVRITLRRNPFHVALGLGRLLYRYPTEQVAALCDLLIQDPDRFLEQPYLRSRKRRLLAELRQRFGSAIRECRGPHGEVVLQTQKYSAKTSGLVTACLRMFTPWHTRCVVPQRFDPRMQELAQLRFRGADPDDEHPIAMRRMHAVLHPPCFANLTRALGLEAPEQCLALPVFHMQLPEDGGNAPRGHGSQIPELTADEISAVEGELRVQAERRRRASIGMLSVAVDGCEICRFDPVHQSRTRFGVADGAERLDVRRCQGGEELLLATYLFNQAELPVSRQRSKRSVVVEGGQEITFIVDWQLADSGQPAGAKSRSATAKSGRSGPWRSSGAGCGTACAEVRLRRFRG